MTKPEPTDQDVAALIALIDNAVLDWDGSQEADGAEPVRIPTCGDLRRMKAALERLSRERALWRDRAFMNRNVAIINGDDVEPEPYYTKDAHENHVKALAAVTQERDDLRTAVRTAIAKHNPRNAAIKSRRAVPLETVLSAFDAFIDDLAAI